MIYPKKPTVLVINVSATGHPTASSILHSSGDSGFDHFAQNIAMASKYKPARKDCRPTSGNYTFTYFWNNDTF